MKPTISRRGFVQTAALAPVLYALHSKSGLPTTALADESGNGVEIAPVYVRPEILADVEWVAEHLEDPSVQVIDARVEGPGYATGHIPTAPFVDMFGDLCCPSNIMEAEPFAELMGNLGIGNDTTVVVYDTTGGLWGARLWWALRYYGHDQAKLLNGGFNAWEAAGMPIDIETPMVVPASFTAEVVPRWIVTMEEVRAAIEDPDITIVDALPSEIYVSGHIPSAISMPAPDLLDENGFVLDAQELTTKLTDSGIDPDTRVITYCGGGYYGAFAAAILDLMGFDDIALYDGALEEWTFDLTNPVEKGP